jgi:uncharacterized membrane protein
MRPRITAVDLLRGLVMVIMAIDHTRDYVHHAAMAFQPEDLTRTTAAIFFTRWITHVCAPAFVFTAGLGAWFRLERRGSIADVSRFLWTRGLWLIVLEFTLVRFALFFNLKYDMNFLLVFWMIGACLILMAALIRLPYWATFGVGLALVVFHNLADAVRPESFGSLAWLWRVLHQPGVLLTQPLTIVAYPLVPWIGVMALGFCAGRIYRLPSDQRRRVFIGLGLTLIVGFVAIRAWNGYGDPRPWSPQPRPGFTVLSFLNTTKYPPSLDFLLMTIGPALVLLGLFDRATPSDRHPLVVFGRTPLLYFVLHLIVLHLISIGLSFVRYGVTPFLWVPPPTMGTPREVFPADYGWTLGTAYAATAAVVLIMYPICLWFSQLRARSRRAWLSYL